MSSIHLPYINIALNAFALIVTIIILASCVAEFTNKKIGSKHFLLLQISVIIALIADIIVCVGQNQSSLTVIALIANTISSFAFHFAILNFMGYLIANLYANSRVAIFIFNIFTVFCIISVILCTLSTFFEYIGKFNGQAFFNVHNALSINLISFIFPFFAFLNSFILILMAKTPDKITRFSFFVYTIFPIAGIIIDYTFSGISISYVGCAIGILVIYTSIYQKTKKKLEEQKNDLMLSQINPHFIYNTLSTIASMCDMSPKQAKYLTIDFSQYLRKNINTLTCKELIPFSQEIEHIECYLKIEKARFRERLNVIYSIQCKDFKIPPLTVQPLVENAVKHGITKKSEGGFVKICTYEQEKNYVIEIIDDGVGFDYKSIEKHVGLQNVKSRLSIMCKGDLSIKSTIGVGTKIKIEIPKKKGKLQ